ncbi:hypothetical protein GCM10010987_80310 [Bradyrhizobium guangdongense]|uniref:Uncharacterized protein n=1 Tax=Bradyrhizobium guangdongense TaxID=1325090 RepID=A0AA87WH77_9BRAD|nr:hypothetical protein GCM10010987_80310 [Bradyrhizobium guangdongense]
MKPEGPGNQVRGPVEERGPVDLDQGSVPNGLQHPTMNRPPEVPQSKPKPKPSRVEEARRIIEEDIVVREERLSD